MPDIQTPLRRTNSSPCLQFAGIPLHSPADTAAESATNNEIGAALIWTNLAKKNPAQSPHDFDRERVPWNDSGIRCVDNEHCVRVNTGADTGADSGADSDPQSPVPIHAHRLLSCDVKPDASIQYAAAQAPAGSKETSTRFLIHALGSGQGIYQFVSPRALDNGSSSHPSILDDLQQRMSEGSNEQGRRLGNRFRLTEIKRMEAQDGQSDHRHYQLCAEDLHGPVPRKKYTAVLTQVGLPFADRVLLAKDIARASALLDAHQGKTRLQCVRDIPPIDPLQLIVSHAGIGRNATLIVYRDICSKIAAGIVNKANLDATLCRIIAAHRAIRGPHYVHSQQQLAALRAALWTRCSATPKPSLADRARRLFFINKAAECDAIAPIEVTGPSVSACKSPRDSPKSFTLFKRSRSLSSLPSILIPLRAPHAESDDIAVSSSNDVSADQAAEACAAPSRFRQASGSDGKYRFHDADAVNGHYSNFWQGQDVTIDGQQYKTVEHYFQSQKFATSENSDPHLRKKKRIRQQIIAAKTPGETKKLALRDRQFALPWDVWVEKRISIMYEAVHAKFGQDVDLKKLLFATGNAPLIESMVRGRSDAFWGVVNDVGVNMLGQILMKVREDLRTNSLPDYRARFGRDKERHW